MLLHNKNPLIGGGFRIKQQQEQRFLFLFEHVIIYFLNVNHKENYIMWAILSTTMNQEAEGNKEIILQINMNKQQ